MKKIFLVGGVMIVSYLLFSAGANAVEKQITYEQMFVTDCTVCHSEANARKIHGTKDEIKKKISEMQKKPGSKISDQDAQKIADFLWDPNRAVFEAKCTKCHTMERISKIHMKGVRAEEMQRIIETMCSKADSGISPAEKKAITEHVGKYCTVK
jgi:hypothetical protein